MKIDIASWLKHAGQFLGTKTENPLLAAQVIIANALNVSREWVLAHQDMLIPNDKLAIVNNNLQRLKDGEPLPYVVQHQDFYCLPFLVTPSVLIPRPETELLVEVALGWLEEHPQVRLVADVGTGSGCIGTILAVRRPSIQVVAVDLSFASLKVALKNSHDLGAAGIMVAQADLLSAFSCRFDMICANLPYIPTSRLASLDVARHEPVLALDGGQDGLLLIEKLLIQSVGLINPGGLILLEIDHTQSISSQTIAMNLFPTARINVDLDLAGQPRLLVIQLQ